MQQNEYYLSSNYLQTSDSIQPRTGRPNYLRVDPNGPTRITQSFTRNTRSVNLTRKPNEGPPSLSNFTGSNFTGFWPGASPNFADSPGSLADAGHAPAAPAAGGGAPRAADAGAASSFAEETFISSGSPNGESGDGRLDLTTRTYMSRRAAA